jgi:hypothetical protein
MGIASRWREPRRQISPSRFTPTETDEHTAPFDALAVMRSGHVPHHRKGCPAEPENIVRMPADCTHPAPKPGDVAHHAREPSRRDHGRPIALCTPGAPATVASCAITPTMRGSLPRAGRGAVRARHRLRAGRNAVPPEAPPEVASVVRPMLAAAERVRINVRPAVSPVWRDGTAADRPACVDLVIAHGTWVWPGRRRNSGGRSRAARWRARRCTLHVPEDDVANVRPWRRTLRLLSSRVAAVLS